MIWPLLISSKGRLRYATGLLFYLSFCSPVALPATITGQVTLLSSPEETHNDVQASGTVIWLSPLANAPSPHLATHARMIQKNKHFSPHILPIQVGTLVDFPNLDLIFHNAFSNFNGQLFDIGLYPPETSRSIVFRREGVVRVFCNIHPAMSAVIVVLGTPFFAVTGSDGHYAIGNVPAGEYTLHFFQERATPETVELLSKRINVADSDIDLGEVKISEAGYIPMPHKNKYGRDYPPDKTDLYH